MRKRPYLKPFDKKSESMIVTHREQGVPANFLPRPSVERKEPRAATSRLRHVHGICFDDIEPRARRSVVVVRSGIVDLRLVASLD